MSATHARRVRASAADGDGRPWLIFFCSRRSGRARRTEAFLAQVLQRRRNHSTFRLFRVERERRPDLFARFGVREPALVVVVDRRVRARLDDPRGAHEIEEVLRPWLRR